VRRGVFGEGDEVLLGGAEDHGVLAAPAVRVLVLALALREQRPDAGELIADPRIGVEDVYADEIRNLVRVTASPVERGHDRQPLNLAGSEVLLPVPGRGVDEPGAGVEGHVVGRDDDERLRACGQRRPPTLCKRVTIGKAEEGRALSSPRLAAPDIGRGEDGRRKRCRSH
jgi:hypothetical protein